MEIPKISPTAVNYRWDDRQQLTALNPAAVNCRSHQLMGVSTLMESTTLDFRSPRSTISINKQHVIAKLIN